MTDQSYPAEMQSLYLVNPGQIELRTVEVPAPGPGELLVKVEAATTCGTDLKAFRRGHPQIPMPGPFGHEYSGVVVAAGEGARFSVGQAVMGVHSAPCQACKWCERGQENLCESIMETKVLGTFAEYLLIPKRIADLNVFEKPESLSFEMASLLEPLSCVAEGVSRLGDLTGRSVLVIGPGAIGLMFTAALKFMGVEDVTLAGRNEARLGVGASLGARTVALKGLEDRFDVVIECTGQVSIWEKSIDFVERGGTLMLFGGCPSGTSASFSTARIHYDDLKLLSPFHFGTGAVRQAREWLLAEGFDLSGLLSGERALKDAQKVFGDLMDGAGIKFVFRPGGEV